MKPENMAKEALETALSSLKEREQAYEDEYNRYKALAELPQSPLEGAQQRELKGIMLITSWFRGNEVLSPGHEDFYVNFPIFMQTITKLIVDHYLDVTFIQHVKKVLEAAQQDDLSIETLLSKEWQDEQEEEDSKEEDNGTEDPETDPEVPVKNPGE